MRCVFFLLVLCLLADPSGLYNTYYDLWWISFVNNVQVQNILFGFDLDGLPATSRGWILYISKILSVCWTVTIAMIVELTINLSMYSKIIYHLPHCRVLWWSHKLEGLCPPVIWKISWGGLECSFIQGRYITLLWLRLRHTPCSVVLHANIEEKTGCFWRDIYTSNQTLPDGSDLYFNETSQGVNGEQSFPP